MKIRIHFVDGTCGHFKAASMGYDGRWVQAIDSESNMNTWIPSHRIHKYVEIGN